MHIYVVVAHVNILRCQEAAQKAVGLGMLRHGNSIASASLAVLKKIEHE